MTLWFILALASALANSGVQVVSKITTLTNRYSKITITFFASLTASAVLSAISYFVVGLPVLGERFWLAVIITGVLNAIAFPIMLKAYELGEFSSVYSMILATPAFLLITGFIFLGEIPSLFGILGVLLITIGLWIVSKNKHGHIAVPNFRKGNLLGLLVAFIWSVTVNFDKIAALNADVFFAPAMSWLVMSLGYAIYLLLIHRSLLVKNGGNGIATDSGRHPIFAGILMIIALGVVMGLSNILHNSALIHGFASYTIAIKRTGVLFGVLWGWLFFQEKNIMKKLLGTAVSLAGIMAILNA
ncbi:MAG: hypothetical protein G01um10143_128 [Parcubacteria group bacterium Gr01-1014_3]|nr:MAG: hypothetical protein G01um10143_128 [Parcubacteria group bacterium Gr01-1014_3]